MRRWLAAWGLASLAIAAGGSYLVWRASVPVAPMTGARVRMDKARKVVIPHDPLMEYPVLLTVISDEADFSTNKIIERYCVRSVDDLSRVRRRSEERFSGDKVVALRWTSLTLDACLRMVQ